ncbi:S8 family serine peptidase [Marinobacter hydrocarbonoclasticus]|nr:S8 family serine peptidase [Marinobacter nauticus]
MGIIDTGINPHHPAFDGTDIDNPLGDGVYLGDCETDPSLCNSKLIGIHSYDEITDVYADPVFQPGFPSWQTPEPLRPANGFDYNGHGTHVASTAAGRIIKDVPYTLPGITNPSNGVATDLILPQVSGVAPDANIIAYQVCWPGGGGDPHAGCPETALLAAIEQAIEDGVDVINFSIGGSESLPWEDAVELAFLSARQAGISVAAAAGNSGPYFYSTDHTSPWLTSVAATTHDRQIVVPEKTIGGFEGGENLPWQSEMTGLSLSGAITAPVVHARDYANPNSMLAPELCADPFPADTFTVDRDGQPLAEAPIVVCDRGEVARVAKAANVQSGGAGGFVLANVDWSESVVADPYPIPGIHVDYNAGSNLSNWLASGSGHRASITASEPQRVIDGEQADVIAEFSSRGPSITVQNHLVPSVAAPGVAIYAAWTPDQPFTAYPTPADYAMIQGTSMASPHVAGAMALLTEAHPEWTPAEIQSALMLTAYQGIMRSAGNFLLPVDAPYYAGSGRIDVNAAIQAGLVMDVPNEEYLKADPTQGGFVNRLNTPNMVELDCRSQCSWLRTVTATEAGTWQAQGMPWQGSEGLSIQVTPAQFTLAAGESQLLEIVATINEDNTSQPWEGVSIDNEYLQYFGAISLTSSNADTPVSTMQVVAGFRRGEMPAEITLSAGRDQGNTTVTGLAFPSFTDLTSRFYGPVAPEQSVHLLHGDSYALNPFDDITDGAAYRSVVIPEGTKRFVAEVVSAEPYDYEPLIFRQPTLIVGRSADGSGTPPVGIDAARPEMLCVSYHATASNYCAFNNPEPGTYWVIAHNINSPWDHDGQLEVVLNTAVIGEESSDVMDLTGPASHDGVGQIDLTLHWNWPDSEAGEVLYGAVEAGPSMDAPAGFGFSGLRLARDHDDIHMSSSHDGAKAGDIVEFTLNIRENLERQDRELAIELALSEGLTLIPDSVRMSDGLTEMLTQGESGFTVAGVQPTSREVARSYRITNNLTHPQCVTPDLAENWHGGYINLHEFGLQPETPWMDGNAADVFAMPIDYLFFKPADIMLWGQPSWGMVELTPAGLMNFEQSWSHTWHYGMAIGTFSKAIAPFFNDGFETTYQPHWEDPQGLTMVALWEEDNPDLGDLAILEYDNVRDPISGAQVDFEIILRSGIDFGAGKPEMIMAYDNLSGDYARGIIGAVGYAGKWDIWGDGGGTEGTFYDILGLDNLDEVVSDDLVICFDYDGPERTRQSLSFQARVHEQAAASSQSVTLTHAISNSDAKEQVHTIEVSGNLQVAAIADQEIDENTTLEGIRVSYTDANAYPNRILVSGEHISATVHGDESGSTFDITPDADWHGETMVTVTVQDKVHGNDITTTTFMLTVASDGVEPQQPDPQPEPESSSSSGSLGYALLALLALGLRRRFS